MVNIVITKDDGTKLSVTMQEAKRIYDDLHQMFGGKQFNYLDWKGNPFVGKPEWEPYKWPVVEQNPFYNIAHSDNGI